MCYWYKLLDCWVNIKGRNGLTIPFIIGVKKEFIDSSLTITQELIADLINDIAASDMEMVSLLFWCGQVREYVIGLDDKGGAGNDLIFYSENKEPTLAIANNLFKTKSLDEIIAILTDKYWPQIEKEEYSKNWDNVLREMTWGAFTEKDIKFIKEALS